MMRFNYTLSSAAAINPFNQLLITVSFYAASIKYSVIDWIALVDPQVASYPETHAFLVCFWTKGLLFFVFLWCEMAEKLDIFEIVKATQLVIVLL